MRNSCYAFALASLAPLLINCGGNDAVVLRQDALVVSPASISVSASAPFPNNIVSFSGVGRPWHFIYLQYRRVPTHRNARSYDRSRLRRSSNFARSVHVYHHGFAR